MSIEEIRMKALDIAAAQGFLGDDLLREADKITVWILSGRIGQMLVEDKEKTLTNNKKK